MKKRLGLHFPKWARWVMSASLLLSLVTGLLWYGLGRWGEVEGEFGPEKHPWLATLTKIHGACAFIALINFGLVLGAHVPVGWRTGWHRRSGIALLATMATTTLSAYGLYYSGDDAWRTVLIYTHLASGIALPTLTVLHMLNGKRRQARQKKL